MMFEKMFKKMKCAFLQLVIFSGVLPAQRPDPGPTPRPDPARDAALLELFPLTTGVREDDHPTLASRGDTAWIAWVSYSETEGNSHIYVRSLTGKTWSEPERITDIPGDYHKPAITIAADFTVWVAWPAQIGRNWDIYGKVRRAKAGWSKTERWTTDAGPDLLPALASAKGRVILVWQALRRNNLDILYRIYQQGVWGSEGFVGESRANDWDPVVAASANGDFHVAWDSYRGDYDVILRTMTSAGTWADPIAVARTPKLENHPSLSVDPRNRLWIAWETGPEKWAMDSANGGLRERRDVGIACFENGKLYRAAALEEGLRLLSEKAGTQSPVIAFGRDGRLRLFYRQAMNRNWLSVHTTQWDGSAWTKPTVIINSEGRLDQRVLAATVENQVLTVYPAGSSHNVIYGKLYDSGPLTGETPLPLSAAATETPKDALPPPSKHLFKGHQLVWGDLHRHTDISEDGGIKDGSLLDAMRYAFDAAPLDFLGITDHTRYLPRRYNLWRIQQITDQYYKPGAFAPLHSYERSQYSPWGHRNIVNLNRDYIPVPANYEIGDMGVSPWGLFAALRGKNAISIPHTSAWQNKQVSWDYYDPEVERLVEIYQGSRSTYEYNGAPDPADRAVYEKDSKNFVWDGLARKRRLGFISSSDHGSTHMSFAAVYTRALDRESIFQALRARRTYAATDRILLDFSLGDHFMGSEVAITGEPEFNIAVEGTMPLARIDIIKDGKFVYNSTPNSRTVKFIFRDKDYKGDAESYYYVRVIQSDKQMAWGSPIWVSRKN